VIDSSALIAILEDESDRVYKSGALHPRC